MVAEVTVFPVPGGPWIRISHHHHHYHHYHYHLDQGQRPLQRVLDGVHLGPVEVGEVGGGEVARQMGPEQDVVHVVAKEPVVDVRRHTAVVHGELPQRGLHHYHQYRQISRENLDANS